MTDPAVPDIPQGRAALVAWKLCDGEQLTIAQIIELCGTTRQAVWQMMLNISCSVPIWCDDTGHWQRMDKKKEPDL